MVRFSDFFNEWLYASDGYYQNIKSIGKAGDFYTSVSTSAFFGGSIGRYILSREYPKKLRIVEIGADRGYLLGDILRYIYSADPKRFEHLEFYIIEPFSNNRQRQSEYFAQNFPGIDISIVGSVEEAACDFAFIVSNELLDAMPCEVIYQEKMLYVDDYKLIFDDAPSGILDIAKKYGVTKGEIPIGMDIFVQEIAKSFRSFEYLFFDYGERASRGEMSVRIYKEHQTFPLFEEGLRLEEYYKNSDITYDVMFDAISDAMEQIGAKELFYKKQNSALVDFGIIQMLEELALLDKETYLREANKVKTLLHPSFLGERFKAISFTK